MTLSGALVRYLAAAALVLGLTFYVFGKIDGLLGAHDAATTAASNAGLAVHAALVKQRAQLAKAERQHAHDQAIARALGDSLAQLASPADTSPWHAVATAREAEVRACSLVVLTCRRRAEMAEAEGSSLNTLLGAQVGVRNHPFGITVGLGATVGVAATGGLGAAAGLTILVGYQLVRSPFP